jgi:hypothetical protein
LADAGVYIDRPHGDRMHIFEGLFEISVSYLMSKKIKDLYVQILPHRVSSFKRFGFHVVGNLFSIRGWTTQWYPMLLRLDEVPRLFGKKDFQREWEAKEGEKLSVAFWKRVMSLNKYKSHILR